jgi:hypothetical protein
MRARRIVIALSSFAVLAAGLTQVASASADSVQVQPYQRASQTEACAAQPGETPWQAAWGADSSWSPSWEEWANNGTGGWTCTRSIVWARTGVYNLGDIGPGGGLVFLISGGLRYEMAPRTWSGSSSDDTPTLTWCDGFTDVSGTSGTDIGTGAANTAALAASVACSSDAAAAVGRYAPAGTRAGQWFLPSLDELNAMCNYSRNPSAPTVSCYGDSGTPQNVTFAGSAFGFASESGSISGEYWSSTQDTPNSAWAQYFSDGSQHSEIMLVPTVRVRPIRAF